MSERPRFPDEDHLDRSARRDDAAAWTARSARGMIACAHYRAAEAGAGALAAGGNAFDAVVAASLALSVCEPAGSGLGGMAMVVLHDGRSGRTLALDGACPAPSRATPEAVRSSRRYRGHRAVALPTYAAVLARLVHRYTTLPLPTLAAPAIRMAREGVPLTPVQVALIARYRRVLRRESAGAAFLGADGRPLPVGSVRPQPALAATLSRLAREGLEEFYLGETADRMIREFEEHGGFLSRHDFSEVPWPREAAPLEATFAGRAVRTMPPPGGGRALVALLEAIESDDAVRTDPDGEVGIVALARLVQRVRRERRLQHRRLPAGETSHLSAMDDAGNAVAMTQSLERSFGAKVLSETLGFLYNNYVKAFKVENRRHPHYLRPGARARSNAAPTLLLEGGTPVVAIGSTGSERMASGIAQVLLRLGRSSPFDAVRAPRLHATPGGEVMLEADRFDPCAVAALERAGFTVERLAPWSFEVGGLHLVVRRGTEFVGVAEPRRDGAAGGP